MTLLRKSSEFLIMANVHVLHDKQVSKNYG